MIESMTIGDGKKKIEIEIVQILIGDTSRREL